MARPRLGSAGSYDNFMKARERMFRIADEQAARERLSQRERDREIAQAAVEEQAIGD